MQLIKQIIFENKYFYILFLTWIIIGFFLAVSFTPSELFFAVNSHHNTILDRIMPAWSGYGRGDVIAIILISVLLIPTFRNKNYFLTTICFALFVTVPIYFLKQWFEHPRPITVFGITKVHTISWMQNLYNNSFPSGHTIGAFGFFLILSSILPNQQKPFSILFFILALGCAYSRLYLGQHFFIDVYAGSIFSIICTTCILFFISKIKQ